jgi:hypothetical protein
MCITLGFPDIQDLLTAIQDHLLFYFIAGFRTKSHKITLLNKYSNPTKSFKLLEKKPHRSYMIILCLKSTQNKFNYFADYSIKVPLPMRKILGLPSTKSTTVVGVRPQGPP